MLQHSILHRSAQREPALTATFELDEAHVHHEQPETLKLLTYNIQVGIPSNSFRHYLSQTWQHVLPHPQRKGNLADIAGLLRHYDVVALQEVDGGSIRSNHMNQVEYLATEAGFHYWYQQLNRNLGKLAQHSNGMLSRFRPRLVEDHKLPGLVPGRGTILAHFGSEENPLLLVMVHLSLSSRARRSQIDYIKDLISDYQHVVIMGDMNTQIAHLEKRASLREAGFQLPEHKLNTYPSWRPIYSFDHILVSEALKINKLEVLPFNMSDHRPVSLEIEIPPHIEFQH